MTQGGDGRNETPRDTQRTVSTLLVPFTDGSALQKSMQCAEDSFSKLVGADRVRVIEKGGDVLINLLGRNDPWGSKRSCTDNTCATCASRRWIGEQQKEARKTRTALPKALITSSSTQCRQEGCNYSVQCALCISLGRSTTYKGESSRSARQRHREHLAALEQGLASSPLTMHAVEEHGGRVPRYIFTIGTIEPRPLYRAIRESVEIGQLPSGHENLNRCQEWGAPRVPILSVAGGDPGAGAAAAIRPGLLNDRPEWTSNTLEDIRLTGVKRVQLVHDQGEDSHRGMDHGPAAEKRAKRQRRKEPSRSQTAPPPDKISFVAKVPFTFTFVVATPANPASKDQQNEKKEPGPTQENVATQGSTPAPLVVSNPANPASQDQQEEKSESGPTQEENMATQGPDIQLPSLEEPQDPPRDHTQQVDPSGDQECGTRTNDPGIRDNAVDDDASTAVVDEVATVDAAPDSGPSHGPEEKSVKSEGVKRVKVVKKQARNIQFASTDVRLKVKTTGEKNGADRKSLQPGLGKLAEPTGGGEENNQPLKREKREYVGHEWTPRQETRDQKDDKRKDPESGKVHGSMGQVSQEMCCAKSRG